MGDFASATTLTKHPWRLSLVRVSPLVLKLSPKSSLGSQLNRFFRAESCSVVCSQVSVTVNSSAEN